MVRDYQRKTTRQSWSEESMHQAVSAVLNKEMGYRKAAAAFDVPQTTLERKVLKQRQNPDEENLELKVSLGPKKTVFTPAEEEELVSYLKFMEGRLFGLSGSDFRKLAFQLAVRNNKEHCFDSNKCEAGKEWLRSFLKRHPDLSFRKPEPTSAARAMGFNKVQVTKFFELLCSLLDEYKFTPEKIFNCDETGICSVPKSKSKILAVKGKKQVGALTSAERGQTVTVEVCFNAAGSYMPPFFIFPRQRFKPEMMNGASPGAWAECHQSGWMQTEIFEHWFQRFLEFSRASKQNPVLLLLDGHLTHTQNLKVIEAARENGVILLCFPPHCTHRLQPLDVTFMKPLSTYYDQEVSNWLRSHPGRVVTIYQIAEIFGNAFVRAATMTTAINGFSATGIWPCNPHIFSESDFLAASTTDRSVEPSGVSEETITEERRCATPEQQVIHTHTNQEIRSPSPSASDSQATTSWSMNAPEANSSCSSSHNLAQTSHNTSFSFVSPNQIIPIPHVSKDCKRRKAANRRGSTAILTLSPYMNELKEKQVNKRQAALKVKRQVNPKSKTTVKTTKEHDSSDSEAATVAKENKTAKGKTPLRRKIRKQSSPDLEVKKQRLCCNSKSDEGEVSSSEEEDEECLYCGYLYSQSDEGWVCCIKCAKWAHCSCAGEDDDDDEVAHICSLCVS